MNKYITILIIIVLAIIPFSKTFAQVNVDISMGTSVPIGAFADNDNASNKAGFAKPGFTMNIDGNYFLNGRLSISGRVTMGNLTIDEDAFYGKLRDEVISYLPDSAADMNFNAGSWLWISPMVGFKYNYPIVSNRTWFEAGIFTGVNFIYIPDHSLMVDDVAGKQYVIAENTKQTDISIPVMIDAGIKTQINKNMCFNVKVSYFQSKAEFEHKSYLRKYGESEIHKEIHSTDYAVPVKTLQFSVGLTYLIN